MNLKGSYERELLDSVTAGVEYSYDEVKAEMKKDIKNGAGYGVPTYVLVMKMIAITDIYAIVGSL